jgi:hypothetical protein
MARGKNRRRPSASSSIHPHIPTKQQPTSSPTTTNCKTCATAGHTTCTGQCLLNPASFGHKSPQDVQDAIDYHWKILPHSIKQFLLSDPASLCLRKFVSFYSMPEHVDNTSRNVAASICGCSWYLALHYMFLGRLVEGKGLILNAAFLQEVYNNKPVTEIAKLCTTTNQNQQPSLNNAEFKQALPFFHDGLFACSSRDNMSAFLRTKLTPTFVAQTSQAKRQAQNYVDYISSSWGSEQQQQQQTQQSQGSNEKDPASNSQEIQVILIDSDTDERKSLKIGSTSTLKALFNKYAEERGVSLRSLRFSYDDKTLFLSSLGSKTPNDLGMKDSDWIMVTEQKQEDNNGSSSSSNTKSKANRRGSNSSPGNNGLSRRKSIDDGSKPRKNRRASWNGCPIDTSSQEFLKLKHSRKLTLLFEEAEPIFTKIRQELNDLSIQRCKPKSRRLTTTTTSRPDLVVEPKDTPGTDGLGSKAGKVCFHVNVGQVENLYKTSKSVTLLSSSSRSTKLPSLDLHGYTKQEALSKLEECLPEWKDTAMKGEYPFVLPVTIVCGGGAQILSETVERWIKEKDGVANAPNKKAMTRRITLAY